LIIGNFGD